jgi:hypothetical protein
LQATAVKQHGLQYAAMGAVNAVIQGKSSLLEIQNRALIKTAGCPHRFAARQQRSAGYAGAEGEQISLGVSRATNGVVTS